MQPLDQVAALSAGARVRQVAGGEHHLVEAHVVHAARTRGWRVITRASMTNLTGSNDFRRQEGASGPGAGATTGGTTDAPRIAVRGCGQGGATILARVIVLICPVM